jgi:uncharacterized pyridoxamine 5'-phosphate oxidase family protein
MNETHPMIRYIARSHGYYPKDPLEAFYNDMYAMVYDPIINSVFPCLSTYGKEKSDAILTHIEKINEALAKAKPAFRPGKWMIGDGSKIYMCDFFYGKIHCDIIANPNSFISAK